MSAPGHRKYLSRCFLVPEFEEFIKLEEEVTLERCPAALSQRKELAPSATTEGKDPPITQSVKIDSCHVSRVKRFFLLELSPSFLDKVG